MLGLGTLRPSTLQSVFRLGTRPYHPIHGVPRMSRPSCTQSLVHQFSWREGYVVNTTVEDFLGLPQMNRQPGNQTDLQTK